MLTASIVGGLCALVCIVMWLFALFGEANYMIHTPECKNFSSFMLLGIWALLALCLFAVASAYTLTVASDHRWWVCAAETVSAFSVALYLAWKSYKTTDFHITGVDYDLILGKKGRKA